MTAPVGAKFNGEVFRKDQSLVISSNRQLASILGIILDYDADGYEAGTVLGKNTVTGNYAKYDDSGASGLNTAVGILFDEVSVQDFPSSGETVSCAAIFGGEVYEDNLVGLDAAAKTDLKARSIVLANANILKF